MNSELGRVNSRWYYDLDLLSQPQDIYEPGAHHHLARFSSIGSYVNPAPKHSQTLR